MEEKGEDKRKKYLKNFEKLSNCLEKFFEKW